MTREERIAITAQAVNSYRDGSDISDDELKVAISELRHIVQFLDYLFPYYSLAANPLRRVLHEFEDFKRARGLK
jgi:hypothetical protein